MKNTLVEKVKRGFYGFAAAAMLSSAGCGDNIFDPDPPVKYAPQSTLNVTPMPLSSIRVNYSCTDQNGQEDIVDSYVFINSDTIRTKSLDSTFAMQPGTHIIGSDCTDKAGAKTTKGPLYAVINPPDTTTQSFSQAVNLENKIDIRYNATDIQNIDSLKLDVLKNGQKIISKTIKPTANQYTELFSYSTDTSITKGNYDFIANWKTPAGKDTSVTVRDSIPTHPFKMNLGNVDFDEETDTTETLPTPVYTNPEDNPAVWDSIIPLDEKTTASLKGSELTIAGNPNQTGDYGLNLRVRSNTGRRDSTTKRGFLHDRLDVSGVLKDAETHLAVPGIVNVYNFSNTQTAGYDSSEVGYLKLLDSIPVNSSGEFNKKLEQRVADLTEDIIIRARWIENGKDSSFIRTIKVPKGDKRDLQLRVVSYTGLAENGMKPEDFRGHAVEVSSVRTIENPDTVGSMNWSPIILKWNSEGPEVIVSRSYCNSTCDSTQGYFNSTTADSIARGFLDSSGLGAWFGRIKNVRIENGWVIEKPRDYGRLVVYPEKGVVGFTNANDETEDGYLDIADVHVGVNDYGETGGIVLDHEIGHASGLPGHAWRLPAAKTTSKKSGNISTIPLFADVKLAESRNEDSYIHGEGNISARNWLGLKYILGLNF